MLTHFCILAYKVTSNCNFGSLFSHDLQIVGNIWDIVSNQQNQIYNIGL